MRQLCNDRNNRITRSAFFLRLKGQGQTRSVRLVLDQIEDVFDGMRYLMEYLRAEEVKRRVLLSWPVEMFSSAEDGRAPCHVI